MLSLDSFTTFGALLKYLRQRQQLTQCEFGLAVGYGDAQINRLEHNLRLPDVGVVMQFSGHLYETGFAWLAAEGAKMTVDETVASLYTCRLPYTFANRPN